jgi:hypothetical protein
MTENPAFPAEERIMSEQPPGPEDEIISDGNPLGIADFETIRKGRRLYADKTEYVYNLIRSGSQYFLSRPRRFGKSLLLSAMWAALKGRRKLFDGLWIAGTEYQWTERPVIELSLDGVMTTSVRSFRDTLQGLLRDAGRLEGVRIKDGAPADMFNDLLNRLYHEKHMKVSVLVDEYDSPVLSALARPEVAEVIMETLSGFYGVLKARADIIGFAFMTGITRFGKSSLFSELDNLTDLTHDPRYADICGFEVEGFGTLFKDLMQEALTALKENSRVRPGFTCEDLRKSILNLYDGYSWDGKTRVLNPWDILNFFYRQAPGYYWWETGSQNMLTELVKEKRPDFNFFTENDFITSRKNVIDFGKPDPTVLMFQTGYLTLSPIKPSEPVSDPDSDACREGDDAYVLKFPNHEVKAGLLPLLFAGNLELKAGFGSSVQKLSDAFLEAFAGHDAVMAGRAFRSLAETVPFKRRKAYEDCCLTVFLMAMCMAGQHYRTERENGVGRRAVRVRLNGIDHITVFRHYQGSTAPGASGDGEKQSLTGQLARDTLDLMEARNFRPDFEEGPDRICRAVIVTSRRKDALVVFGETECRSPGG